MALDAAPNDTLKDEVAEAVVRRWDELAREKALYHGEWETIATLLMTNRKAFSSGGQPGQWQHRGVFDSSPVVARNNLAAGLYGTATNPANRWLVMETPDEDLNGWHAVKTWLDVVNRRVLASFRASTSNFYDSVMPLYGDIVAFGTSVQYDEPLEEQGRILDKTMPLSEVAIAVSDAGELTEMIRRFTLKPADAARTYGDRLPPKIRELAQRGDQTPQQFFFALSLSDDFAPGGAFRRGMKVVARTVCAEGPRVVREGGYYEMPAYAPRWDVDAGETWGRGQGYFSLPTVRMLNLSAEANIRAAQWHADPATLAPDQIALRKEFRLQPGATLYGAMTMGGRPLLARMDGPRGLPFGIEQQQDFREQVKEMFGFSLLTVTNRSGMTTAEFLERQADRLRLMAPFLGRIQSEYLTRKAARRFAILWRAGQIPPPPPELAGRPLDVRYVSAAAMAQRSTEAAATANLIQNLSPLMGVDPRYAMRLDPDGVAETLADGFGAPARALRSREQADALERAAAERQQAMAMAEMAPGLAGAARDMAEAGAAGQGGRR